MITLYGYPTSPNTRKVLLVLAEKGLEWTWVNVDLLRAEQKSAEFLRRNPHGKVPVVDIDGRHIWESTIINEYLEERYPRPPLLPADPIERARARMLEDYCDTQLAPAITALFVEYVMKTPTARDRQAIEAADAAVRRCIDQVEQELDGNDYLVGRYTLADAAFTPFITLAPTFGILIDDTRAKVRNWVNRLTARPSFRVLT
ncbi:MAG: glutathione S-transferase family protein [Candidatus Binatia bacterium]